MLRKILLRLREDLYLMYEKDKVTISVLIEIEDHARHHERLTCTSRHIEEEMLARLTIPGLEEVDKILDRILLIWPQLLG